MTRQLTLTAALLLTTTAASAAGIDRTLTNYGTLFEVGNYVELSYANVSPRVSGEYTAAATAVTGQSGTGTMSEDFSTLSGSLKYDLNDRLALGLYVNQPFGADASYPQGLYRGLAAEWNSIGTSIVMKYKATPNISIYGGARSIESEANIVIPSLLLGSSIAQAQAGGGDLAGAGRTQAILASTDPVDGPFRYTAQTDKDRQTSYIIGAAYERPEIALRVALTYESGYTHSFNATETFAAIPGISGTRPTDISMPDVYTLDFQSGVATDTLVFGSIRHATWSDWHVRPDGYATLTGDEVTGVDTDSTTYRIGVGRKFSDSLSGFVRVTHEPGNGDTLSRLAPTDGSTAYGFGGTYTTGPIKVTGGVEYITFGEGTDAAGTVFAENDAVAIGVSVGYRF
ncbi:hypothetical protein ACOI1H_22890 [Loktanella sp. DJP18]|uniref:hypothetical protein n=1 Tax=Loktanella sp. DJP18 TaxID=3409788 RepID=UPI003BB4FD5E